MWPGLRSADSDSAPEPCHDCRDLDAEPVAPPVREPSPEELAEAGRGALDRIRAIAAEPFTN